MSVFLLEDVMMSHYKGKHNPHNPHNFPVKTKDGQFSSYFIELD